jgi:hypothetical protein
MAHHDLNDTNSTDRSPGAHRLRICNLPAAFARGAPATETTLVQLIYQHTGIPTFNPRTGTKLRSRHSNFAYAFIDVHTYDDGINLIAAITNIVTTTRRGSRNGATTATRL